MFVAGAGSQRCEIPSGIECRQLLREAETGFGVPLIAIGVDDFYGETYEAYVDDLKAVQECLGDIQDSEVLGEFLTDFVEGDLKKELPILAGILAQNRYEAWQKWQILQRKYLNSETRQGLRSTLINPVIKDAANGDSPEQN